MTEAAAAVVAVEFVDLPPLDLLNPLDDQLGDPVASIELEWLGRVGVDQHHLDLASVGAVNETRGVHHADAVTQRESRSRQHEPGVTEWQGDGDAGRHERSTTARLEAPAFASVQVESGVTVVGIGREGEISIESDDLDPDRPTTISGGSVSGRLAHITSVGSDG